MFSVIFPLIFTFQFDLNSLYSLVFDMLLSPSAKSNLFDVVLIDTAGRMQDNEPLMRALAKLVADNNPDKIIFVGEALVGNEAVDQVKKFDRALKDFSGLAGEGRGVDGIVLTKFDTIDDKVMYHRALCAEDSSGI